MEARDLRAPSGIAVLALFQTLVFVAAGSLELAGVGAFTLVGNLVQFTDQADAKALGYLSSRRLTPA